MIDGHSLLLFMAAGLALNITPGPDMLYVAGRSAGEGRASGIVSALGIGAGTLVHIALVAGGLATLLTAVPIAFTIVRLLGAGYLIYLGVRALRTRAHHMDVVAPPPAPLVAVFRQGAITNILNPKVALFFLAFLPQFVDTTAHGAARQIVTLGLLFDVQGTIVNLLVALAASGAVARLSSSGVLAARLERLTGVLFIGLGIRLAAK